MGRSDCVPFLPPSKPFCHAAAAFPIAVRAQAIQGKITEVWIHGGGASARL
jgi:hypothetical protein